MRVVPDVRVRDDERPGREPPDDLVLSGLPDRLTVRELIRTRVREEAAIANADRRPRPARPLLVTPYEGRPGRMIDWQEQADVAVDAFGRQAFFVFVDGEQVETLDDEVSLHTDSEVRFLRLTPLVGG
jgi:hypothetical protein